MKYAVALPADQTIVYVVYPCRCDAGVGDHDKFAETTKHPEATLFESREAVDTFLRERDLIDIQPMTEDEAALVPDDQVAFVEEVSDEAEFRARKDTW